MHLQDKNRLQEGNNQSQYMRSFFHKGFWCKYSTKPYPKMRRDWIWNRETEPKEKHPKK